MSAKYKIVETRGCTAFGVMVNGKDAAELGGAERTELLDRIFSALRGRAETGAVDLPALLELLEPSSYSSDAEPCDQCGDTVSQISWEV